MIKEKVKTTKEKVEKILSDFPETRNSDKKLIWVFWNREGYVYKNRLGNYVIDTENFLSATKITTIVRVRSAIQNDEKRPLKERYLPTDPDVAKQRKIAQKEWKEAMLQDKQGVLGL